MKRLADFKQLTKTIALQNKHKYSNKYNEKRYQVMDTMSYSAFRTQLAGALDKVNEDQKPLLVTRQNGKPAVVMSLEEFHSYEETAYLMASPRNAARLAESIAQIESGEVVERGLIEE